MGPTIESVAKDLQDVLSSLQMLVESQQGSPRELALVKTKVQEAAMWLEASKLPTA